MRLRTTFHFCSRDARNIRRLSFLIRFSIASQGMRSQSKTFPSAPIPYSVPSFTVVRNPYFDITRDTFWKSAAFRRGLSPISAITAKLLLSPEPFTSWAVSHCLRSDYSLNRREPMRLTVFQPDDNMTDLGPICIPVGIEPPRCLLLKSSSQPTCLLATVYQPLTPFLISRNLRWFVFVFRLLTLSVFPLIRHRNEARSLGPFMPFFPSVSSLTSKVGGVRKPFYAGTGRGGAREPFGSFIRSTSRR